jgi:methionyl-tRNA synthetase
LKLPQILFRKIEDEEIAEEISKLKSMSLVKKDEPLISIDDFKKLDIGVGEVVHIEDIIGSDKLYKLKVRDGTSTRQIVAGLKDVISKEDLLFKQVLILKNLQKAMIRGVESQGMILALKEGKTIRPLTLEGFALGSQLS